MPKPRETKENHLLHADAVDSRGKSGVWFGEREQFKTAQNEIIEAVKEKLDWVPVENAIMAVSLDPPGIALIVPNPSLPGIIILADGASQSNTDHIKDHYTALVRAVMGETASLGNKE